MKRIFDLLLALAAAVVLAVPVLLVAVAVRLTSPGPALYWSDRVGRHNKLFKMPKFRSMRVGTPAVATHLLGFLDVDNPSAISRQQMDEWVAEGVVDYLGRTDDVRPFLAQADCVVLPSYREGVPRTLLEAAATARPVITTDAPGCRDTVLDGQTGFLCRVADAPDLADKLLRFIALPLPEREAMGQRGRAFVELNFDERLVIGRYLDVVQAVAAERPVGWVRRLGS